ncbi:MAG: hypothetical protein K0U24_02895 [Gammaproteobacteria bacterium]|nr:hypothetical protein [Gammaproteobacteria bacterium]MCH9763168.1 hypothetical protein [Gammaproteobacteria bacterium]
MTKLTMKDSVMDILEKSVNEALAGVFKGSQPAFNASQAILKTLQGNAADAAEAVYVKENPEDKPEAALDGEPEAPAEAALDGKPEAPVEAALDGKPEAPVEAALDGKPEAPVEAALDGEPEAPVEAEPAIDERAEAIKKTRADAEATVLKTFKPTHPLHGYALEVEAALAKLPKAKELTEVQTQQFRKDIIGAQSNAIAGAQKIGDPGFINELMNFFDRVRIALISIVVVPAALVSDRANDYKGQLHNRFLAGAHTPTSRDAANSALMQPEQANAYFDELKEAGKDAATPVSATAMSI